MQTATATGRHLSYEAKHIDDVEWETIRWPGETGKMLFQRLCSGVEQGNEP